tara:strand:- start:2978 stop:3493 length:516 start_codon:yes stop_codon:yes gene_type:complete
MDIMKKKYQLIYLLVVSLFISNCNPQRKIAENYSQEIECLGSEMDGSITVKAFGKGKNRKDALEQAKKNAVNEVIFKGLRTGKSDCGSPPLLSTPNAREKYEDYFNRFFADGGGYAAFATDEDERTGLKLTKGRNDYSIRPFTRENVTHNIVLRIKKSELKQKLRTDKIIK